MRIFSIIILIFLLSALAIGVSLNGTDDAVIDSSINNVSQVIDNISLQAPNDSQIPNAQGFYKIIESGVKFVGVLGLESFRAGIHFGKDNPEYFSPEFIIKIIKLMVILVIVYLLIKQVLYILIFLVMGIIWIRDKLKERRKKNETNR